MFFQEFGIVLVLIECSPDIQQDNYCSAYKSAEYDSVDEFLDTISKESSQQYAEATTTDFCSFTPPSVQTNLQYSNTITADTFLDSLVDRNSSPSFSTSTLSKKAVDPPTYTDTNQVTMNGWPHKLKNSPVTQGSQTDICSLPSTRQLIHTGSNTTPKFTRDKSIQFGPITTEACTSPHVSLVDHKPIQGWDSPVDSPPLTPEVDIPSYFTSAYQARRRELNLPEGVTYQGATHNDAGENPLPPYLDNSPRAWGNTPKPDATPKFQLMEYLEDLCTHITPPI